MLFLRLIVFKEVPDSSHDHFLVHDFDIVAVFLRHGDQLIVLGLTHGPRQQVSNLSQLRTKLKMNVKIGP